MLKALGAVSVWLSALFLSAACTVHSTQTPPLSGPSELATSVTLTANPDRITVDGASQSLITAEVRDPNGESKANVPLRVDMVVGGVVQDYGQLTARTIVTGTNGRASVTYTAPALPSGASLTTQTVSIRIIPIGTDAQASVAHTVDIRLVPPGVILPPADTPTPNFTISPAAPTANLPVRFDASTSCAGSSSCTNSTGITSFAWDFGDGTSGTGQTTTHTFTSGNTFSVTLTITNDRGLSASQTQGIVVGAGTLPVPSFTFSPSAPGIGEPVFFNAGVSTPGAGHTIASYRWTFGDGGTGSGATTSHAYSTAGTYSIQLTVTDESGQSVTSAAQSVTVGSPPTPVANFTFSPTAPSANQSVVFDASTSTTAQGQTITQYAWSFGDGTPIVRTSTKTIGHTFGFAGTFNVNLTVTDSAGRTNAKSAQVTVGAGDASNPTASFTFTPSPARVNTEVSFDGSTSTPGVGASSIIRWEWDFGDGTPVFGSSVATVGYTYRVAGTYTAKLTVTNSNGKSASTTRTVIVQ